MHLGCPGKYIFCPSALDSELIVSPIPQTGALMNKAQDNCPTKMPDSACPVDKTGATGTLINHLFRYQCAYPHGACTWDAVRVDLLFL